MLKDSNILSCFSANGVRDFTVFSMPRDAVQGDTNVSGNTIRETFNWLQMYSQPDNNPKHTAKVIGNFLLHK